MPSAHVEEALAERLWARVRPLLPPKPPKPKGGRPRADDRACFDAILFVLRSGCRWRDLTEVFPSPATCWRRHRDWTDAGVWYRAWQLVLGELQTAGRLDTSELALDGTFVGRERGPEVGAGGCGKGMTVELAVDRLGTPLGAATAPAHVHEVNRTGAGVDPGGHARAAGRAGAGRPSARLGPAAAGVGRGRVPALGPAPPQLGAPADRRRAADAPVPAAVRG